MLLTALGARPSEAFRIGYAAGLANYLVSLYWLLHIPYRWHGVPLGPAVGWLALSAYCAIYPALWVYFLVRLAQRLAQPSAAAPRMPPSDSWSLITDHCSLLASHLPATWRARALWTLAGAGLWVALEMVIARLFTGFPWNLLGASQYQITPIIQISEYTGIYGVSFLVIWVSLSFACALARLLHHPARRSAWIAEMVIPILAVAVLFNHGFRLLRQPADPTRGSISVTLVQPSIPQTLIWDSSRDDERFAELLDLSRHALTNRTDLLIWPEASVPRLLRYHQETHDAVTGLARSNKVWMIIGADDAAPRLDTPDPDDADYYNSSFLISPNGEIVSHYQKRRLVIFGEYIPLIRWLPFLQFFTPIQGGFASGDKAIPFELADLGVTTSVLICFEDIFPALGREASGEGEDFLVNITNNGWFGESAAQWQHAASAVFRAVENRIGLVRCSNNGLTCRVDERGVVREQFRDAQGTVYGAGFLRLDVPLPQHSHKTFYRQHGDLFGWTCAGLGVGIVALTPRRKPGAPGPS
jgi:apolipoprotein N-acyltransferase